MKKLILLFIPLLLSCVSQGNVSKPDETFPIEVNIRIYGTNNLLFSGEYGNNSDTTEVNGTVPPGSENYVEYTSSIEDTADIIFANFKKEQEQGGLKVSIYLDGWLKKWEETSESYGTVSLTWKP